MCKVEIARRSLVSGIASFLQAEGAVCCRTECCHTQNPVECIAVSVTSLPDSRNCNVFTPRRLRLPRVSAECLLMALNTKIKGL